MKVSISVSQIEISKVSISSLKKTALVSVSGFQRVAKIESMGLNISRTFDARIIIEATISSGIGCLNARPGDNFFSCFNLSYTSCLKGREEQFHDQVSQKAALCGHLSSLNLSPEARDHDKCIDEKISRCHQTIGFN